MPPVRSTPSRKGERWTIRVCKHGEVVTFAELGKSLHVWEPGGGKCDDAPETVRWVEVVPASLIDSLKAQLERERIERTTAHGGVVSQTDYDSLKARAERAEAKLKQAVRYRAERDLDEALAALKGLVEANQRSDKAFYRAFDEARALADRLESKS